MQARVIYEGSQLNLIRVVGISEPDPQIWLLRPDCLENIRGIVENVKTRPEGYPYCTCLVWEGQRDGGTNNSLDCSDHTS